ncbi:MAG: acylphosphatase [bacterium]
MERTVLVRYEGQVQGVGFRANVRRVAGRFKVRGWVKNERDGSVSLIATAESAELDALLAAIRVSPLGPNIIRETCEDAVAPPGGGFDIRY